MPLAWIIFAIAIVVGVFLNRRKSEAFVCRESWHFVILLLNITRTSMKQSLCPLLWPSLDLPSLSSAFSWFQWISIVFRPVVAYQTMTWLQEEIPFEFSITVTFLLPLLLCDHVYIQCSIRSFLPSLLELFLSHTSIMKKPMNKWLSSRLPFFFTNSIQ